MWLFDTDGYTSRWEAAKCDAGLGAAAIACHFVIAAVYTLIPYLLVRTGAKRPDLPYRSQVTLFAAFVACCGVSRFIHIATFWTPIYRIQAAWDVVTAAVSVLALWRLRTAIPVLLAMRTPAELQTEIEHRKSIEGDLRHTNKDLQNTLAVKMELEARIRQLEACHTRIDGQTPTQAAIERVKVATQAVASALPLPPRTTVTEIGGKEETADHRPLGAQ